MLKLSNLLGRYATGRIILVLLALEILFPVVIMPLSLAPLRAQPGAADIIDFLLFYTPATASSMIASYGEAGRAAYLTFALAIDIAHPIVYSALFGLAITRLIRRGCASASRWQLLNLVPIGSLLFDLLENLSIATLLWTYPASPDAVAWMATGFTMAKWVFTSSSLVLVLIAAVFALRGRRHRS